MLRSRSRWVVGLAGTAVIASSAPTQAAPTPVGSYVLRVAPEHGPATTYRLRCDPDGGTIAAVSEACDQLESANGEVRRIPARQGACTMEYSPVRVTADGTWRGEPRHFARTYPNRCSAMNETGGMLFR
ncbi:SSI family serine proteinase inhibitor [Actinomadura meridiana]